MGTLERVWLESVSETRTENKKFFEDILGEYYQEIDDPVILMQISTRKVKMNGKELNNLIKKMKEIIVLYDGSRSESILDKASQYFGGMHIMFSKEDMRSKITLNLVTLLNRNYRYRERQTLIDEIEHLLEVCSKEVGIPTNIKYVDMSPNKPIPYYASVALKQSDYDAMQSITTIKSESVLLIAKEAVEDIDFSPIFYSEEIENFEENILENIYVESKEAELMQKFKRDIDKQEDESVLNPLDSDSSEIKPYTDSVDFDALFTKGVNTLVVGRNSHEFNDNVALKEALNRDYRVVYIQDDTMFYRNKDLEGDSFTHFEVLNGPNLIAVKQFIDKCKEEGTQCVVLIKHIDKLLDVNKDKGNIELDWASFVQNLIANKDNELINLIMTTTSKQLPRYLWDTERFNYITSEEVESTKEIFFPYNTSFSVAGEYRMFNANKTNTKA